MHLAMILLSKVKTQALEAPTRSVVDMELVQEVDWKVLVQTVILKVKETFSLSKSQTNQNQMMMLRVKPSSLTLIALCTSYALLGSWMLMLENKHSLRSTRSMEVLLRNKWFQARERTQFKPRNLMVA